MDKDKTKKIEVPDENRDPLSGAPGAHPVGTGTGATAGGLAGAAIGAMAGPIGAVAGLAAGAVAGGLAGKAAAEAIDPTAEDAHWRDNYRRRPYVERDAAYDLYRPAYEYGWTSRSRYPDQGYDEIETELQSDWKPAPGTTTLDWEHAKPAVRDAWEHADKNRSAGI